jgi:adenylate cyclase
LANGERESNEFTVGDVLLISKRLCAGLLIGLAGILISFFRSAHDIEESVGLGLLFKLRGARQPPAEVVIVSIDKESADQLKVSGNPSRWPRSLHAELVKNLTHAGARLIFFDLYFIEPRSPAEDEAFAAVLRESGKVILGEAVRARDISSGTAPTLTPVEYRLAKTTKPIDLFAHAAAATAPFVLPRLPVRVNRYWTFQPSLGQMSASPVVAFQLYTLPFYTDFRRLLLKINPGAGKGLPENPIDEIQAIGVGQFIRDIRTRLISGSGSVAEKMIQALDESTPLKSDLQRYRAIKSYLELYYGENYRYLNFYGPPRTIRTIPFYRALHSDDNLGANIDFKDKVVFVGLSETLLTEHEDSFHTVFSDTKGIFISGVEILATAFANLVENSNITLLQPNYYLLLIFSWGVIIGLICLNFGPLGGAAAVILFSGAYLTVAERLFATRGLWIPLTIPLFVQAPLGYLGTTLWVYFEIKKERQNIRKLLKYSVPDEVVRTFARKMVDLKKADQLIDSVCLYTDIAAYTTVSESLNPLQLNTLIERYLVSVLEPIKRNGGLIVQFKGDSILSIWKAPGLHPDVRQQSCKAALEVAMAVQRFNQTNNLLKLPTRIGVHAGEIFLGNVGTADNYEYGPRGDTVNTTQRLDDLNKQLGTEILVSNEALQGLEGFLAREAGRFLLKGKSHPVTVFELFGPSQEATQSEKNACTLFTKGLEAFRRRSWGEAEEIFQQLLQNSDHRGLPNYYLSRCERYKSNSPASDWDGTITIEHSSERTYS